MKNKIIATYYLLIASVVAFSVFQTIFEGSLHMAHGQKIAILTEKQQMLQKKRSQLQLDWNHETSLAAINQFSEENNYQPISSLALSITASSREVASR